MNKKGFTLIEILVVVLIIGALSAIALPGYRKTMEKAKAAEAIQTLSDISKAENDYYLAKNEYTNDFSDLILTMKGKNILNDEDHSSYATEHFVYNLDDNQDLATASRDKGADSYILYRFYEDPRTYCEPEGNKYCEMLGLVTKNRAGTSIGNWQSCEGDNYPCTKECTRDITTGYNCNGTYNKDGTFSEMICATTSGGEKACINVTYDEQGNRLRQTTCELGYDQVCYPKTEKIYDESGNLRFYRQCQSYDDNRNCTEYKLYDHSPEYTYDENKNLISARDVCLEFDSSNNCVRYGINYVYSYDKNGNKISERDCQQWGKYGSCEVYGEYGTSFSYDKNGNQISSRDCEKFDSNNQCVKYGNRGQNYTYDDKGNKLTERDCISYKDDNCTEYQEYGSNYAYTYDKNGNVATKRHCSDFGDNNDCVAWIDSNQNINYNYDANGRLSSQRCCNDHTCNRFMGWCSYDYVYGTNSMIRYSCEAEDPNCSSYYQAYETIYDENNNIILSRSCEKIDGKECIKWGSYISYE